MKQQTISVITINYNNKNGLERTIKSVISQTYSQLEYIIIDGGSTDGSLDVIKKYADKISYWISEPDKGIYNAMNKGIVQAHGDYCNFMNSGDTFYDNQVLEDIFSEHQTSDILTGITQLGTSPVTYWYPPQRVTFSTMFLGTISHQGSFIKTNLLKKNYYNEEIPIVADWAFFLKVLIIENCTYYSIKRIICNYDMTGVSSTTPYNTIRENVLKSMFPDRVLMDFYDYACYPTLYQRYNKSSKLGRKIITLSSIIVSNIFRKIS